jgi:hypothetical protein
MPARRPALTRAEHDELEAWARELPSSFLECRDLGHDLRPFRAWYDETESGYRRILRCRRCKSEKLQWLNLDGTVRSGGYDYADGYLKPPGTGVLDAGGRGVLRLVSTLRLIDHTDELEARRASRRSAS